MYARLSRASQDFGSVEACTFLVHTVLYFQILFLVAVYYGQVLFALLVYQHLRFHFLNYCLHKFQLHIFCNQFSRIRRWVHIYQVYQLFLSESNYGSINLFKLVDESVNFWTKTIFIFMNNFKFSRFINGGFAAFTNKKLLVYF